MSSRILLYSKNDLKIILLGTMLGGILQVFCLMYLKNHPELLNTQNPKKVEPVIGTKKTGLRRLFTRGGAILEVTGARIIVNVGGVIISLAKKGFVGGMLISFGGVTLKKIPSTAICNYLRDALPHSHTDLGKLEKQQFILIDGEKIYLDQCDQNFKYLFKVLSDKNISPTDKDKLTHSVLMDYLDLRTTNGRIRFILCIINILHIFSVNDFSNYFILMQNLIKAVKEGRIPKRLARLIIRKLIAKKISIDPNLIDAVY